MDIFSCVCICVQEHLYIPFSCFLSLQGKVVIFRCRLCLNEFIICHGKDFPSNSRETFSFSNNIIRTLPRRIRANILSTHDMWATVSKLYVLTLLILRRTHYCWFSHWHLRNWNRGKLSTSPKVTQLVNEGFRTQTQVESGTSQVRPSISRKYSWKLLVGASLEHWSFSQVHSLT